MSDPAGTNGTAGSVVRAEGLHRRFDSPSGGELHILRGIELAVAPGESLAIVGPSGSGKSTLLHLLGALDRPSSGEIWLGDHPVSGMTDEELAARRNLHVGFVFQFHHLLRDFTAIENVMMPQLIAGVSPGEAADRAASLLAEVGLSERLDHHPRKLSGGEQQRVAVARALANQPPLVLADEPSGNLDVEASERLHDLLFRMIAAHGSAVVVVTHSPTLADRAGRILRLEGGALSAG